MTTMALCCLFEIRVLSKQTSKLPLFARFSIDLSAFEEKTQASMSIHLLIVQIFVSLSCIDSLYTIRPVTDHVYYLTKQIFTMLC